MSDKGFIDIGDELILRVEGFPVGKAVVTDIKPEGMTVLWHGDVATVPVAVHDYEVEDGVTHERKDS